MFFDDNIKAILTQTWPTLLLISVVAISMRLVYVIKNKEHIILYKEVFKYLFIIYIICLFYVVTFQDVSWSTSNFIPFKEIFRYPVGSKVFMKNVLGNMILFIPYGFFVSYFLKLNKALSALIMTCVTSITIEVTQSLIGRVFDVDDIILNLLGGLIGFIIFYVIYKVKGKLPNFLKKPFIYNIIIVLFMILVAAYLLLVVRIGF